MLRCLARLFACIITSCRRRINVLTLVVSIMISLFTKLYHFCGNSKGFYRKSKKLQQQLPEGDFGYNMDPLAAVIAEVGAGGDFLQLDPVGAFADGEDGKRLQREP